MREDDDDGETMNDKPAIRDKLACVRFGSKQFQAGGRARPAAELGRHATAATSPLAAGAARPRERARRASPRGAPAPAPEREIAPRHLLLAALAAPAVVYCSSRRNLLYRRAERSVWLPSSSWLAFGRLQAKGRPGKPTWSRHSARIKPVDLGGRTESHSPTEPIRSDLI